MLTPEKIAELKSTIDDMDVLVIAGEGGLSLPLEKEEKNKLFEEYFGDFREKYGIKDMESGCNFHFASQEEYWAYWSRYIYINRYMNPPKDFYGTLLKLIGDKPYFVVEEDVSRGFHRGGFDNNRIFSINGDLGLFQCAEPCHNKVYENYYPVREMLLSQGFALGEKGSLDIPLGGNINSSYIRMEINEDLIPLCPICDKRMITHISSNRGFFEEESLLTAKRRYGEFLERIRDKKALLLEIRAKAGEVEIIAKPFGESEEGRQLDDKDTE